jgi:small GTP-binding protein
MTSIVSSFLSKFFPRSSYRCLFLGLDASGKTSILYRLVLGEIVTTIPTIGFNVETITHGSVDYECWDVGGCDKIRPLIRHYYDNLDCVIHVIDSKDFDRLDGGIEGWGVAQDINEIFNHELLRDLPLLILFNKQDLPQAKSPQELMSILGIDISKYDQRPIQSIGISALTGQGMDSIMPAIENLVQRKSGQAPQTKAASNKVDSDASKPKSIESIYEEWLTREDEDDDIFLSKLDNFSLDSWDHRTHLRIAFILLHRCGRRDGMKLIFEKIQAYIAHGSYNTSRTTFHETMTYFWVHMVDFAIARMRDKPSVDSLEQSPFKLFLLLNPHLVNGGLFLDYYTKELMLMNPDARKEVMLPDIKPLPSILSNISASEAIAKATLLPPTSIKLLDHEFYEKLQSNSLSSWGHEVKLRGIYVYLVKHGRTRDSLEDLMTLFKPIEHEHQHLTLTYFWLHILTLFRARTKPDHQPWTSFNDFISDSHNAALLDPRYVDR